MPVLEILPASATLAWTGRLDRGEDPDRPRACESDADVSRYDRTDLMARWREVVDLLLRRANSACFLPFQQCVRSP